MKKLSEKKAIQEVMIERYVDEARDAVNTVYPSVKNGKRNWKNFDEYEARYSRNKKVAELIKTEVLDDYIIKTNERVEKISRESRTSLLFGGTLAGLTILTAVLSNGNPSILDTCALVSGSFASILNIVEGIVKGVKARRLAKHSDKIYKEWNTLSIIPNYVEDFCTHNKIIVKDSPFSDIDDSIYIERNSDEDLKVTTEERAFYDGMREELEKYSNSQSQEEER